MNIVICEDDLDYRIFINSVISEYINKSNSNSKIVASTSSVDDVLDYIQTNSEVTLYYIDIRLCGGNEGLELAAAIREKDRLGHIIFITNYSEMMPLTYEYKLEALDYIVKGDTEAVKQRICAGVEFVEQRQKEGYARCLNIANKQKNFSVPFNEICYIESIKSSHKLVLYYDHGMITFYGLLKEVEEQLDDRFIRCHKSIILNRDKIINTDKTNHIVELKNGYRCGYSTKCKELV